MKFRILILALVTTLAAPSLTRAGDDKVSDDTKRVNDSATVIHEFAAMSEGPPRSLVEKAAAVIVIPGLKKAGLGIGGKHGSGVLSVKGADNTWSDPVFVKMTGGSIGWQIGVSSTDLVLLFMNERSYEEVLDGEFTVGGEANVAAGPVGRSGSASTDAHLDAEIYSYSRSKGLFGGIAIDGSKIYIDKDAVARVYGGQMKPTDIVTRMAATGSPGEKLAASLRELTAVRVTPSETSSSDKN
jgi:lipid-binding SYLF domain-containing protein